MFFLAVGGNPRRLPVFFFFLDAALFSSRTLHLPRSVCMSFKTKVFRIPMFFGVVDYIVF